MAGQPNASVSPRNLYLDVVAQNCRSCHTQLSQDTVATATTQTHRTFETYDDFVAVSGAANRRSVRTRVYDEAVMPLARLTMDRFWVELQGPSTAADQLAAHLNDVGEDVTAEPPGAPVAVAELLEPNELDCSISREVDRNDTVRLSGSDSRFADIFAWALEGPSGQSDLVGATTELPVFVADAVGNWTVSLTVTNDTGQVSDPVNCQVIVPQ